MNIEPTVQISDRVFTDLTLALRFVKESIELYEARDETKQIDAKLKQS